MHPLGHNPICSAATHQCHVIAWLRSNTLFQDSTGCITIRYTCTRDLLHLYSGWTQGSCIHTVLRLSALSCFRLWLPAKRTTGGSTAGVMVTEGAVFR